MVYNVGTKEREVNTMIKEYDFCRISTGYTAMSRGFFEKTHKIVTCDPFDDSKYACLNFQAKNGNEISLRAEKSDLSSPKVQSLLYRWYGITRETINNAIGG